MYMMKEKGSGGKKKVKVAQRYFDHVEYNSNAHNWTPSY